MPRVGGAGYPRRGASNPGSPKEDLKPGTPPPGSEASTKPGETASTSMPEEPDPNDPKEQLARHIGDLMVEKGFSRPEGHLLVDVYHEVWKDLVGEKAATCSRAAMERFTTFLESMPHLFDTFRLDIGTARCAGMRKLGKDHGELMVMLKPLAIRKTPPANVPLR